jgi:tRNA 2-thiouridine synthesizing protein A
VSAYTLDVKQLLCPLPVIRTQDRVATLKIGDVLTVYCTDPGALSDIPTWCRLHGHTMLSSKEDVDGVIELVLKVGSPIYNAQQ